MLATLGRGATACSGHPQAPSGRPQAGEAAAPVELDEELLEELLDEELLDELLEESEDDELDELSDEVDAAGVVDVLDERLSVL